MPFFAKSAAEDKARLQVRAVLAFLFAGATIGGFFLEIISPETFMPIATMTISWYFAKRNNDEASSG